MALCDACGDPNCAAYREALRREPWLPGGFELGAQWHSHDGGLTWLRGECGVCRRGPQFIDISSGMTIGIAVQAIVAMFPSVRAAYCNPNDYVDNRLAGDRCDFPLRWPERFTVHVDFTVPVGTMAFAAPDGPPRGLMTVVAINRDRGEVVLKVTP